MKKIIVNKGTGGWGGPITIYATEKQKVVASVTGGGIHPLAAKIAEMLDVPVVDGFNNKVEPEEIIIVVVDCGGTLRCGVYPKMGVKTIDLNPISPSGPLSKFMTTENFVSGVTEADLKLVEDDSVVQTAPTRAEDQEEITTVLTDSQVNQNKTVIDRIAGIGKSVGAVVNIFYQAGRDAVDICIKNIIPFMAFVSAIVGIILYSGIGDIIATYVSPLAGSLPGLLVLSIICGIPFLSPLLGPGAVIAQVVGVLLGVEIGNGNIPVAYSLPALFAINSQVGCDFVPVALSLADAGEDAVKAGVPAMLFTRLVTGPTAVVIAYVFSFGLYT